MGQERLTCLALLNIYHTITISIDDVINRFANIKIEIEILFYNYVAFLSYLFNLLLYRLYRCNIKFIMSW
ncbi:zinc finger MYM-type protein 1-like [Aphis craccivora]|uniref:Zinc finger MYM-type protein 1-like n=1 Tax=Aphis craccivora TaxID=307492 RepID=A0A6G0Y9H2_APHCR|nr:zinc finger MYM-type protein 1-like [Aphis craccivora]